jgi:hypothetical protein
MERASKVTSRRGRFPTVDLESPKFPNSPTGVDAEDATLSEYESSAEDNHVPAAPHTLLSEDPFSTKISRTLFDSIGIETHSKTSTWYTDLNEQMNFAGVVQVRILNCPR